MKVRRRPMMEGWRKHLIGGVITLLTLFVFFDQVNSSDVLNALSKFQWVYLFFGLAFLGGGYALRIIRWSLMLKATGAHTTFKNCAAPFLGSIALNNILPLRLGDVIRALVFPGSMGISKTTATSSLIVERLIDLMTLLASLAIGLFAIRVIAVPEELKASAILLAIFGSCVLILGFLFSGSVSRFFKRLAVNGDSINSNGLTRIYRILSNLMQEFEMMSRPRLLLSIIGISMLVWLGEAGLFYFVLLGSGVDGSPLVALLVMAVATLSTLLPSSPGYVGTFHLAAFSAITLVGGTEAQAGSYAVIVHLTLWLPTTLAGALAIWSNPGIFRTVKLQSKTLNPVIKV